MYYQNRINSEYKKTVVTVAQTAASLVDINRIEHYAKTLKEDEYYEPMLIQLRNIQKGTRITYLTISQVVDGGEVYLFDADLDHETQMQLGQFDVSVDEVYMSAEPYVQKTIWGVLLTSNIPLYNEQGTRVAYVNASINMNDILRERNMAFLLTGSIFAFLFFIFVFIFQMFIRKLVTAPIAKEQSKLAIQKAMLDLVLETIPDPIYVKDSNFAYILCNKSFRDFLHLEKDDIIGRHNDEIPTITSDFKQHTKEVEATVQHTQDKVATEVTLLLPSGKRMIFESVCVPFIHQGFINGYIGMGHDISAYKEMLSQIENRGKLISTINSAATLMLSSDDKHFMSPIIAGLELIGHSIDADRLQIWQNEKEEQQLYFTHKYEWLSDTGKSLKATPIGLSIAYGDVPRWEQEFINGNTINCAVRDLPEDEQLLLSGYGIIAITNVPLFIHDEFWGFLSIDNCRSERIYTEEELQVLRSAGLLIASVFLRKKTDIQLDQALKDALIASQTKSTFLANMSHEVRTPLNVIIGLTDLVLEEQLPNNIYEYMCKISSAGNTLLSIVNDILDFSKVESGNLVLNKEPYQISSLLSDIIALVVTKLGEKPIKFRLFIGEDFPNQLYGDNLRVKQILNNLLSNAIKYTTTGTIDLAVNYHIEQSDIWLEIIIKDTGCGMRQQDVSKLFTDYFQIDSKANRRYEGTGLGLPITKRIAELMEGSIQVESELGVGSTFTVTIKQGYINDAVIGPEVARNLRDFKYFDTKRLDTLKLDRIALNTSRVLVVDDMQTNLDVAAGLLSKYQMQVDFALSGKEAIDLISRHEHTYDAIFMDHMMPGMDGIEATDRIRQLDTEYAKRIPIIALTANAVQGAEQVFYEHDFQDFISKPIDIFQLDRVIRKWIY